MKFNCIKCGKFICKLDLRKVENRDEDVLLCKGCLGKDLENVRELFN